MYKIEKTDYGIRLLMAEHVNVEEMTSWLNDFKPVVDEMDGDFCVFVDMRTLIPITSETRVPLEAGQKYAKDNGMKRSVVILSNPVVTMQFKGIAHQTGIYEWERYIDASQIPNWESIGFDWLKNSVDPDRKVTIPQI